MQNCLNIIGSVIARIGSKRLPYKNLLPYQGVPLVLRAVQQLIQSRRFDQVVLSTDSELIARTCMQEDVSIIRRPDELSGDSTPSVPVFQHIVNNFPCDIHLNYNCNFPECPHSVFDEAIEVCKEYGESLSNPYAVWAQTSDCLASYEDPLAITAVQFRADNVQTTDIHEVDDLLHTHQFYQEKKPW